jgi:hypothetical protein
LCRSTIRFTTPLAFCAALDLVWFNASQASMPKGATDQGPGPFAGRHPPEDALLSTGDCIAGSRRGLRRSVQLRVGLESAARKLVKDLLAVSPMGLRKTKEVMTRAAEIEDLAAVLALEEHTQMACMQAGSFGQTVARFAEKKG